MRTLRLCSLPNCLNGLCLALTLLLAASVPAGVHEIGPQTVSIGPFHPTVRHTDIRHLPKAWPGPPSGPPRDAEPGQEEEFHRQRGDLWSRGAILNTLSVMGDIPSAPTGAAGGFGIPAPNVPGINYTAVVPADPNGDAGPNHYVQAVNGTPSSLMAVYDKGSGALLAGPTGIGQLGSGECMQADTDPQVIHDGMADRWLLVRLAAGKLCVLISSTGDPINTTWSQYIFELPFFPDYPKLAVWPNGYAVVTNNETFDAAANGYRTRFAVLDRMAMLAGQPATAQIFMSARYANNARPFTPFSPIGLKGFNAPKPGTPILFAVLIDDEFQFFGEPAQIDPLFDRLEFYSVIPDFANAGQSQFTGPEPVLIGDVQLAANQFPMQPGGVALPSFNGTLMHRSTYRNLGDREVIVLSSNAPTGSFSGYGDPNLGRSMGALWFELARVGGTGQPWTVVRQELFGPGDGISRFMSAVNVDNAGNLALAYAVLGEAGNVFPGLRYTGRRVGDPAPGMTLAESNIATGVAAQPFVGASQRWGDYFDMSLDPDGCRFWFTGQYMDDTTWGTRVVSFRHDDCGPPDFAWVGGNQPQTEVCGVSTTVLPTRALTLQSRYGYWRDLTLSFDPLPAGVSASVNPQQLRPSGTVTAQLSVAEATPAGLVVPRLIASDGTLAHSIDLPIKVDQPSAIPALTQPANAAVQQPTIVRLSWAPTAGADDYVVDVATNAAFTPPLVMSRIVQGTFVDTVLLAGNTAYHWRVRGRNTCGEGISSGSRSFTTIANFCRTVNQSLAGNSVREDTITVPANAAGVLQNLDIRFVQNNIPASAIRVDLTRVSDNRTIRLLESGCNAGTSINTTFDDAAADPTCDGNALASRINPTQSLETFDGVSLAGDWRIRVENTGTASGQFILWCLQPQSLVPAGLFGDGFEG